MSTPTRRHKPAPRDGLSYSFGLGALAFGGYAFWLAYDALHTVGAQTALFGYNGKFTAIAPMIVFVGLNVLIRGPSGIDVLNTPGEDKPSKLNIALMIVALVIGLALAFYVDHRLTALGHQRASMLS